MGLLRQRLITHASHGFPGNYSLGGPSSSSFLNSSANLNQLLCRGTEGENHSLHFSGRQSASMSSSADATNKYTADSSVTPKVPIWNEFSLYRWSPDKNEKPKMQLYRVNVSECGPMVLDVLGKIKNELDPTVTYRRSCREGICGSCSMNIDGQNGLACLTPVNHTRGHVTTITPLPHMFVIKDLVVDLSQLYQQYKSIEPWLKTDTVPKDGREFRQSPRDRAKLNGRYECILCFCCSTACPEYWWNSERFLSPAVLINANRWVRDSRDQYTRERLENLSGQKMFRCHTIFNCAKACPKHLNPGKAIQEMKRMVVTKEYLGTSDVGQLKEAPQETRASS
eukprot:jgi/Mesen1/9502/ME000633S08859